jgi:uncharacterized tellurite resistance protein B-like protein
MLKKILNLLATPSSSNSQPERIPLAAAVLLLEVAYADGHFSEAEEQTLNQLLEDHFALDEDSRRELLELAQGAQQRSVDLHRYTRLINHNFSQTEKESLIEAFWQLTFADGQLDAREEAMMRQLSSLIGLSHRQLIDAKLKVRGTAG